MKSLDMKFVKPSRGKTALRLSTFLLAITSAQSTFAQYTTVAGGLENNATAAFSTVGGGAANQSTGLGSTISGGHTNYSTGVDSFVGGGSNNQARGDFSSVNGGTGNQATGRNSAIGGGYASEAPGEYSYVSGGYFSCAGGNYSWAGGYLAQIRPAYPSGQTCLNATGTGFGDSGTFIWSDYSPGSSFFTSTGPNQFLVRARGGVGINSAPIDPSIELTVRAREDDGYGGTAEISLETRTPSGTDNREGIQFTAMNLSDSPGSNDTKLIISQRNGVGEYAERLYIQPNGDFEITGNAIKPGGGSWIAPSDRRLKDRIVDVETPIETLMKLHPVEFHYNQNYRDAHRIEDKTNFGFIAQEFAEVFPEAVTTLSSSLSGAKEGDAPLLALDSTPAMITTIAAAQQLAVDAVVQRDELNQLKSENAELRARLEAIEAQLNTK